MQDGFRFLTDAYRFATGRVARSRLVQSGLTVACLAGLLWLNAAHLIQRMNEDLAVQTATAALSARTTIPHSFERPLDTGFDADAMAPTDRLPGGTAAEAEDPGMPAAEFGAASDSFDRPARAPEPAGGPIEQVVEVRKGDTLMAILVESGIDLDQAQSAVSALEPVFAPRDLMPGQEITLNLDLPRSPVAESVELVGLSLQPSVERNVTLTRGLDGGFVADAIAKPLTTVPTLAAASITSSLFEASQANGVPARVMGEVIRGLSYDVDFQRDLQPGDTYELVYERVEDEEGTLARTGRVLYAALSLSGKTIELYGFAREDGRTEFYNPKGENTRKALLRTPIDGARISSKFGMRKHPILGYSKMHKGVDFAAPQGTPVFAAGDGVVTKAGRFGAYGKYVQIKHGSGYATAYAHLSRFAKGLKSGSKVRQGQVIAYVGSTGRSTGPHLHFEVLKGGSQINPVKVQFPVGEKLKGKELKAFQTQKAAIDRLRQELRGAVLMVADRAPTGH